jgi:hypothetical protein
MEIPLDNVHLFSAPIVKPLSDNLCKYTADDLIRKYSYLPAGLEIPKAFGLPQAMPYITRLKITDQDFCGDGKKQEPYAMIRGEVQILLSTNQLKMIDEWAGGDLSPASLP